MRGQGILGPVWRLPLLERQKIGRIPDAAQGKRNLIIGEPGVGKTFLLTKIQEHLNSIGFSTCLISLKDQNLSASLSQFLDATGGQSKALRMAQSPGDESDESAGSLRSNHSCGFSQVTEWPR
jgi:predicted ATP-binding protein involved in virulence